MRIYNQGISSKVNSFSANKPDLRACESYNKPDTNEVERVKLPEIEFTRDEFRQLKMEIDNLKKDMERMKSEKDSENIKAKLEESFKKNPKLGLLLSSVVGFSGGTIAGLMANQKEIIKKLDNLTGQIENNTERIESLEKKVDDNTRKLNRYDGKIEYNTKRLDNLEEKIVETTTRVNNLDRRIEYNTQRIDNLSNTHESIVSSKDYKVVDKRCVGFEPETVEMEDLMKLLKQADRRYFLFKDLSFINKAREALKYEIEKERRVQAVGLGSISGIGTSILFGMLLGVAGGASGLGGLGVVLGALGCVAVGIGIGGAILHEPDEEFAKGNEIVKSRINEDLNDMSISPEKAAELLRDGKTIYLLRYPASPYKIYKGRIEEDVISVKSARELKAILEAEQRR